MHDMIDFDNFDEDYQEYEQTMPKAEIDILLRDIEYLNKIKFEMARLQKNKEMLEEKVKEQLHHQQEGSRTYDVDIYKVTVTTNKNYSVNKSEYEIAKQHLCKSLNPVKEKITYSISAGDYHKCIKYASNKELELIGSFVTAKDAKLSIKITANE